MSCPCRTPADSESALNLPHEFEDIGGLIEADIQAIASTVTSRAHERLLLTRREYRQLHRELRAAIVGAINQTLEPLSAECR